MFNSNTLNSAILASIFAVNGCASNSYHPIPAEPVHVATAISSSGPETIIADAYTINHSYLFDSGTAKRIKKAIEDAKDDRTASISVREILCNGDKPRVKASLRFNLVLNRPTPSTPIDVVAQKNQLLISEIPFYLKAYWLHEASRPELVSKRINPDFDNYYESVVETNGERKTTNQIGYAVPFLPESSKQGVEKFFMDAHAIPTLKRLADNGPVEWYPSRNLLSIEVEPHRYILSNKVVNIFSGVLGERTNVGEEYINTDVQFGPTTALQHFSQQDGIQFRTYSNFTVSPNKWKLPSGVLAHPIQLNVLSDLAQIRRLFVFRIPMPDLKRLFRVTEENERLFGYRNSKFSPETALEYADYTWHRALEPGTEVLTTVKDDSSVIIEVRPHLEMLCKYAVPTSSLVAQ